MASIYLSATYKDLKPHRDAVYHILRKLRHDVVSMEDYVASEAYPLQKCLADVANCDVYVGLIGWRYGYVPERDNLEAKSITELEYRQAGSAGKPRLLFLADPAMQWPDAYKDAHSGEGDSGKLITAFRGELETTKLVSHFQSPDHLAGLVSVAVTRCLAEKQLTSRGAIIKRNEWFLSSLVKTASQARQINQLLFPSGSEPTAKPLACVFADFTVECPDTLAFKLLHELNSGNHEPKEVVVTVDYNRSMKPDEWLWTAMKENLLAEAPTAKAIQLALQSLDGPSVFVLDLATSQIADRPLMIAGLIRAWQSLELNKHCHCLVLLQGKPEPPNLLRRWGLAHWARSIGKYLGETSQHLIRPDSSPAIHKPHGDDWIREIAGQGYGNLQTNELKFRWNQHFKTNKPQRYEDIRLKLKADLIAVKA